jgi:rod shape-determining protein MreD
MKGWRIAILLFLLLLFQASVLQFIGLPLSRPDLALLLTIYVSLGARAEKATITGFFAGIFQDAVSIQVPGLNSFAKSLVGFLGPALRRSFLVNSFIVRLLAVAVLTAIHAMVLYWMGEAIRQKTHETGGADFFMGTVLPTIGSNLVFWILLHPIFRRAIPPAEEER